MLVEVEALVAEVEPEPVVEAVVDATVEIEGMVTAVVVF